MKFSSDSFSDFDRFVSETAKRKQSGKAFQVTLFTPLIKIKDKSKSETRPRGKQIGSGTFVILWGAPNGRTWENNETTRI